jgi:hypothetical protein
VRSIEVPWRQLSEVEQETLQTIALPISLGLSLREVARAIGDGITWLEVAERYEALKKRLWELSQEQ